MEFSRELLGGSDLWKRDLAWWIFMILAFIALPILGVVALRIKLRKKPYAFEMIFMRPGVNKHILVRGDKLNFTHEIDKKKYKVQPDRLYRVKPSKLLKFWMKFTGVKEKFIVSYQHKKTSPIFTKGVKVSTRILKEVNESRALGKAMRSEFKVSMDLKKILMIVGVVVIGIIAYLIVMGDLVI